MTHTYDWVKIDPSNPDTHPPDNTLIGVEDYPPNEDSEPTHIPDKVCLYHLGGCHKYNSDFSCREWGDFTHWCHLQSREARELAAVIREGFRNFDQYPLKGSFLVSRETVEKLLDRLDL